MSMRSFWILPTAIAVASWAWMVPAHALTMKECSTKYEAAKSAGSLKGMNWNEFRKAECGANASANAPAAAKAMPQNNAKSLYRPETTTPAGSAVFPTGIAPKYADQSAGRARMRTCLDQYEANKTTNGNGGLKWIQKGGGYYSQCNKRLSSR